MSTGRRKLFLVFMRTELDKRFLIAGIAYWMYVNLLFSSSLVAPITRVTEYVDFAWLSSLVGQLISLLLIASILSTKAPLIKKKVYFGISLTGICAGALLFQLIRMGMAPDAWIGAAGCIAGVGTGFTFVFFAEIFAQMKLQFVLFYTGAQTLLGSIFYLLAVMFLSSFALLLVLILASLQTVLFFRIAQGEVPVRREQASWLRDDVKPTTFSVLALFIGACYGLIRILTVTMRGTIVTIEFFDIWGSALAGILLVISCLFFLRKNPSEYIYQIVFPTLAFGFAMIPLLFSGIYLAFPIVLASLAYFYGLLWFFITLSAQNSKMQPTRLTALVFSCLQGGQLVGILIVSFDVIPPTILANLATLMLFATVIITILFFSQQKKRESEMMMRAQQFGFESQCHRISEQYGFTPREQEIHRLLALGLSPKQIEKGLVLSPNTVKTHVRHIYEKLGVHSREEFRELLKDENEEFQRKQAPLSM